MSRDGKLTVMSDVRIWHFAGDLHLDLHFLAVSRTVGLHPVVTEGFKTLLNVIL